MRLDSHVQLPNTCMRPFLSLEMMTFFHFCTIAVFSLYGEYVVRFPPLPDGVFLLRDHGLDLIHHQLNYVEFNQSINYITGYQYG